MLLQDVFRSSPSLADALPGAERAATTDSPILILGESGAGTSTLARAFHRSGSRRGQVLVEVDPGAIPITLFESELFGYRRGAFTGAESSEEGRLAQAHRGTLLLDHVQELPLEVQPKLLRVLAERRFAPLGGQERAIDVRIIATAREDLAERARCGTFREDLYYRLEVLAFRLPPLRERRADLPHLTEALLEDLCRRLGRPRPRLSERAWKWMSHYSWPGNLRQLRNLLERNLVIETSGVLDPEPPADTGEPRPRSLAEAERIEILRALAYTRGHQGRAAEILGISRKGLWEKRRRLGIP